MDTEGHLELLKSFTFTRLLNQDPLAHSITLLGTIQIPSPASGDAPPTTGRADAILTAQKTHFDTSPSALEAFASETVGKVLGLGSNDCYWWMKGWSDGGGEGESWKINLIAPATEVHIKKYSVQKTRMVRETPELYRSVVLPYIEAFPASRTTWVTNILSHITESNRILYEDPSPTSGFILIPDLKWDQKTLSSLYLLALAHSPLIRSLRDLRPSHLPLLKNVRSRAYEAAQERYGVGPGELRMFVHYQPSYYRFHIHVTHIAHLGFAGITVGQAHLLEEIIENLEEEAQNPVAEDGKSYYARKVLWYGLGEGHGLSEGMVNGTKKDGY